MLWPWYIFSIQTRPDLSSHITKSYIFSSCNRSYSYALIIDFGISSVVKPEPREFKKTEKKKEKKNGFLQDVGCSERCGLKFCFLQQQLGKYNHFSQYPALYMKVFYCCHRRHVPQSILWLYLDCRSPILYWELFQNTVCAVVH